MTPAKFDLKSSGTVIGSSPSKVSFEKSLKHFPGPSLPARPALYVAYAFETGFISRASTPVELKCVLCFTRPLSTTYLTPGMVTEVSATFVLKITLVCLRDCTKTLYCSWGGRFAYRGKTKT